MTNLRNIATLAVAAVACGTVLTGCASHPAAKAPEPVTYKADYPSYDSSDELLSNADLVIKARVDESGSGTLLPQVSDGTDEATNPQAGLSDADVKQWQQESGVVVTISSVIVTEVIKGDVKVGDNLKVSQLGGTVNGVVYQEEHTAMLQAGNRNYVLALKQHGDDPADLLNPAQAMYDVGSGDTLTSSVTDDDGVVAPLQGQSVAEVTKEAS